MRYIILILLATTFTYCNNAKKEEKNTASDSQETSTIDTLSTPDENSVDGCYMLVLKRDTMVLHLQNDMNILYGKLNFDNFEKDGSTGSVQGELVGDIMKLTYTFASEGMNSVMDVYFKVSGDKLTRGIGEMKTKGDTAYFVNPAAVDFSDKNYFSNVPCENVPAKYRL